MPQPKKQTLFYNKYIIIYENFNVYSPVVLSDMQLPFLFVFSKIPRVHYKLSPELQIWEKEKGVNFYQETVMSQMAILPVTCYNELILLSLQLCISS